MTQLENLADEWKNTGNPMVRTRTAGQMWMRGHGSRDLTRIGVIQDEFRAFSKRVEFGQIFYGVCYLVELLFGCDATSLQSRDRLTFS
jgi:hypothetical protein